MTIVIERRSLNARGYFSLYYLSLIIYKSQKQKKSRLTYANRSQIKTSKWSVMIQYNTIQYNTIQYFNKLSPKGLFRAYELSKYYYIKN